MTLDHLWETLRDVEEGRIKAKQAYDIMVLNIKEFNGGYASAETFTKEDLEKAFKAGRTVENYKGSFEATYVDDCTSCKYDSFDDWFKVRK